MLNFHVLRSPFDSDFADRLLAHALENERHFMPSEIYSEETGQVVDRASRQSLRLVDFDPLQQEMRTRLAALLPTLLPEIGVKPFEPGEIEIEMVAHGDGARFASHIDMRLGGAPTPRLVTAVYYFHREPRGFEGGAIRFHSVMARGDGPRHRDLMPEHDSLVVFPAWLPHEVMPVACPSGRFADSRFAVNAWFLRRD